MRQLISAKDGRETAGRVAQIEDSALLGRTRSSQGRWVWQKAKPRDFPPFITPGARGEEDPLAHRGIGRGAQNG